ncbi:MBL fold metallo-hydrolase [Bdellovibrio sp. HCB2-146]|uniref:MBL fold metallo-hydrolase n=1 Tax=Bdellovibrio sp. HCB2-146 TaxID=3394362 RepID=UPI0039BC767B
MSVKVSRILHAGYVFECEGTQIAFDTIFENPFSRNCYAFPDVEFDQAQIRNLKFSAVFISHYHDDHCSLESLNLLDRETPIYMYCVFEEIFTWIQELGFKNVYSLTLNKPVNIGAFEVIPRRALDAEVDSLFQIKAAGMNILNVVDSWIDYDTLELLKNESPWDMILWPFQTMRELEVIAPTRFPAALQELPPEWIEQLQALDPRFVVPSSCQFKQESWSWYNNAFFPISYQFFQEEVQQALPSAKVIRLNPSVSILLGKQGIEPSAPLPWVKPKGEQNLDYQYLPALVPPATAEIAKNFPELNAVQTQRVYKFCEEEILQKYTTLDQLEESFFDRPRNWRLSVFDHTGAAKHFTYSVQQGHLQIQEEDRAPLEWSTEVPLYKLFAALDLGESLTSMYVRINSMKFSAEIEKEMESVDIMEDPLVRCLFTSEFGSYQLEQLKRIKGSWS